MQTQAYFVEHTAIGGGFVRGDIVTAAQLEAKQSGLNAPKGEEIVARFLEIGAISPATPEEAGKAHAFRPLSVKKEILCDDKGRIDERIVHAQMEDLRRKINEQAREIARLREENAYMRGGLPAIDPPGNMGLPPGDSRGMRLTVEPVTNAPGALGHQLVESRPGPEVKHLPPPGPTIVPPPPAKGDERIAKLEKEVAKLRREV